MIYNHHEISRLVMMVELEVCKRRKRWMSIDILCSLRSAFLAHCCHGLTLLPIISGLGLPPCLI
jgi:hypothetical protein